MKSTGDLSWPLRRAVRHHGTRVAVVDRGRELTYAELGRRSAALAAGMRRLGLRRGDVVAILAGNSIEYVECWLGIPAAGFVLNPLNIRLALPELEFILGDSGARALVTDARFHDVAVALADRCPAVEHVVWADSAPAPAGTVDWEELVTGGAASPAEVDESSIAAISYTGGTTGLPKGVVQTHGNLLANARHVLVALPLSADDRFLHASPMFHAAGAANVFSLTWQGGTHVVLPSFDAPGFCAAVAGHGITSSVIVPTMLNAIVEHVASCSPAPDLATWNTVALGAAPPPLELLARAVRLLPCDIRQVYGATETSPHVTSTRAGDVRRWVDSGDDEHLRSCGVADVGVEVEVWRLGTEEPLTPGGDEIGEVVTRGPNVMVGYWNRPEETAKALTADAWYRTGDLGYLDAEGYLYLVDRAKDMIISGGENVYTVEVENAIHRHPAVLEATVFGIPDPVWGELVHAEVVVRPGMDLTTEDLVAECRRHIAGFKVPRSVHLRTEPLPKSGANKVLKRELRDAYRS